jgi:hypothetical protein
MIAPTNRPPLWRVMEDAVKAAPTFEFEDLAAAELRAIAGWLVPERDPEALPLEEQVAWAVHCTLRQRLLDEADRAEAGE